MGEIAKTIQTSNGSKVTYVALAPGYVIFSHNDYEKCKLNLSFRKEVLL